EILGSAVGEVELRTGALRRPDGEAGLVTGGGGRSVELLHRDAGGQRGELRLGERIDLGADVRVAEELILVGLEIDSVGVRADMRIVAEAGGWTGAEASGMRGAAVVRCAVQAVVRHIEAVDGPGAGWVAGVAHRQVASVL